MAKYTDIFNEGFSTSKPGDMKNPMGLRQRFDIGLNPAYTVKPVKILSDFELYGQDENRDRPATGFEDAW